MMELFNKIVNFITEKFDVLFSGAGVAIITAIASVIFLIANKANKIITSRRLVAENLNQTTSKIPLEILEPAGKKNPLKVPAFKLIRTRMSFTGGYKPVKDYEFKVTNSGGKAFNVAVSGSILPESIELQDINRHGSKSFTLAFGGSDLPQEIAVKIKCLDEDGDSHSQVIRLHLVAADYIAT